MRCAYDVVLECQSKACVKQKEHPYDVLCMRMRVPCTCAYACTRVRACIRAFVRTRTCMCVCAYVRALCACGTCVSEWRVRVKCVRGYLQTIPGPVGVRLPRSCCVCDQYRCLHHIRPCLVVCCFVHFRLCVCLGGRSIVTHRAIVRILAYNYTGRPKNERVQ